MAFSCKSISQAMVSKKVMLARAAEASRKTSPEEASWHSSGWQRGRKQFQCQVLQIITSIGSHNSYGGPLGHAIITLVL